MSAVRARGNRSTEWKVRSALVRNGIRGWKLHPKSIPGVPDFFFPGPGVAIFVDGCFWHQCPTCRRPLPKTNRLYWKKKLERNRLRSLEVSRELQQDGIRVIRVWEHELRTQKYIEFLQKILPILVSDCRL